MLKEFYDFIAKKINSFFQTSASDGNLLKGESFCLKLDDEKMVEKVYSALRELSELHNAIGVYHYPNEQNSVYETYTLRVQDDEIIIAAQIKGMTNDFLCATLRNAANEAGCPLLMISANPIDSAKSGSRDMSASGMPFHSDNLMNEIRLMVEESTQLTVVEKRILSFELERRDLDVFSDKESLYEYKDLLAIMSSGEIDKTSYEGFRLFPIDAKTDYQHYNQSQIDKEIKDNNTLFEKIDRAIRFGNLEGELSKIFKDNFISKIEREQKKDNEHWTRMFKYAELVAEMQKKEKEKNNPLNIENTDISVYGDIPLNSLNIDDMVFVRNEGAKTSKKRTKNIMIFNPESFSTIHIRVNCNIRISSADITIDDSSLERDGKDLIFKFDREGLTFHKLEIKDDVNSIKYILKICIVDLLPKYLIPTVKRNFIIDYKTKKSNCRIKLVGVSNNVIFNANCIESTTEALEDNETYDCSFERQLVLHTTEEELANFGLGIKVDINFAGIMMPFVFFPDEVKSVEITGRRILRDKMANKKSFEFENETNIYMDTQEYFAKTNLLRELRIEQKIIDSGFLACKCIHYNNTDNVNVKPIELTIPKELQVAYMTMLKSFSKNNTVPTLAYLAGEIKEGVINFLNAFDNAFSGLKDGEILSVEQENALKIGTLEIGKTAEELLLTPFHPVNLKYQLALQNEKSIKNATDIILDRLTSVNLLPYLQRDRKIYKVSDQMYSLEWKYYAPIKNTKYRGNRKFVPKLVEEKITEFSSHFRYIFDDINNKTLKINLINMGDCSDVFVGIAQYFIHSINKDPDVDKLKRFEIHIYSSNSKGNAFLNVREYKRLKQYLEELRLTITTGTSMSSLEGVLSRNIVCYFHDDNGKDYTYSHITFYEMESEITAEQATSSEIETGLSLGGIISGVPSSKYGHKYRTGFGTKYADDTELISFVSKYNALIQVDSTGNPYHSGVSISTQIDSVAEVKMDYIYGCSNWVVFVDPKVDLDFFCEKEAESDLLIIHYSDQYTSSSGYDAITVTHKSQQYALVIQEFLKEKGVEANIDDVHNIINLFNAINGDWLLRLVSSKRGIGDSTFSREKISIVAAIRFMLSYLKHPNIIWIPISLEEMLRVSGGAGLSKGDGILSAKNLGFEKGPTSDDLLFVGLDTSSDFPKIYLYPVEVKTGNNDNSVIKKAFSQVSATAKGLEKAFSPEEDLDNTIFYKVNRNFLMQLIVTSCKKMKVYHVDDSQDWDRVLVKFRQQLLNENYVISSDIQELLGKGAVLSFRKGVYIRKTSFVENFISFIEMPEIDEFDLILESVESICKVTESSQNQLMRIESKSLDSLTGDLSHIAISDLQEQPSDGEEEKKEEGLDNTLESKDVEEDSKEDLPQNSIEKKLDAEKGMKIVFGINQQNSQMVVWKPNDTSQLFHTNTGIIGTMGTGKTQFTKSLITQLYKEQNNNIDQEELGILIFDYKGDYNESKPDFVESTDAQIFKPFNLPFNPLALTRSKVEKPLLPMHTANAFKDTISKVYNLGPIQQDVLNHSIMDAYSASGISKFDNTTWDNEAPTFDQVYQRYIANEEVKKTDSLAAAMNKLHDFQVFEPDPRKTKSLFELLKGVVVIDLSGYDSDIQNLIVAITLDLFYSQMQAAGSSKMDETYRQLTKMILVDEADNFMSQSFPALKRILKEGREFGVGTILSTQFLKHFGSGDDDYSKYILTWIVHNVSDLKANDVGFVFNVEPKGVDGQHLFNQIKSLEKHNSIIKIGNGKPIFMKDKAFWELYKELGAFD